MGLGWWCCTRERPRRLVIRGASSLVAIVVFMVCMRPFGAGCEQASGNLCRWDWLGVAVLVILAVGLGLRSRGSGSKQG